ncbi:hypothetical protein [Acinetobacter guerrae]|nr:hypothetical protein [Acinetobacter guerrae]
MVMLEEISLPMHMREFDEEKCQFKYKTTSCLWMGFSKAWQYQQKRIDELQTKLDAIKTCIEEKQYKTLRNGAPVLNVADLEQALKGGEG